MVNSIRKGKAGEREWANHCKKFGFSVRRTQQYAGGTEESADCIGLPNIHQEVKRVEALNIYKAIEQAEADCKDKKMLIVAHRKNGKRWLVTMYSEDWFNLYKQSKEGRENGKK